MNDKKRESRMSREARSDDRRQGKVFRRLTGILCLCCVLCFLPLSGGSAAKKTGWEVTQYVEACGNQGMFYSLRSLQNGTLIVIDGGTTANARTLRKLFQKVGSHIDVWFLTHYHPDHIGTFNTVWDKMKKWIKQVYVTPIDYETYESVANQWDDISTFRTFLEKTKDSKKITALHRGDEFEIKGLKIQIFNAFDEHVKELSGNWCNDCSLVIKVTGEEESMLFLGDLSRSGAELGEYILDTFGEDEVRADYVQASHHGNQGLPISFYERIRPKEIFFNAPEWLMTGDQYDAKDLEAWCKEQGIVTHDYREGKISFILH